MKFPLALLFCGFFWFGVSAVCMPTLFTNTPAAHLVCAIATAFIVGFSFRGQIHKSEGWRRYVALPLGVLAYGTIVYGLLVPASWWLIAVILGHGGVDAEAFVNMPAIFLFYSFTIFLPVLFPVSLCTNWLLRRVLNRENA